MFLSNKIMMYYCIYITYITIYINIIYNLFLVLFLHEKYQNQPCATYVLTLNVLPQHKVYKYHEVNIDYSYLL